MIAQKQCDARPCSEPACRRVIFRLPTDASQDVFEKFMKPVNLCADHYALTAVGRDLFQLLGITVAEWTQTPAPRTKLGRVSHLSGEARVSIGG